MTQTEFKNILTTEQQQLLDHLEENDRIVHLFEQDGMTCAEVENWTDRGVDMVITLMPFSIESMEEFYEGFDIDEEIDLLRQDDRYRKAFRISDSLRDFEKWKIELGDVIDSFYCKAS
ncbi:hypothetical protein [Duncaniella muris]|uniref:hypothetical protein n=1 Tax=Duncaniella muris TaxID=2094150 RepID=UPI00263B76E6|nr:hypothetical protein [Duncaniella muris]